MDVYRTAQHLWNYFMDFLVVHMDNTIELVEIRSHITMTSDWRKNRAMLEATLLREFPDTIKYTVLTWP
jgi:hypothetical protein